MYKYKVLNNQKITPTTRVLTLQISEEGRPLLYRPGQYAAIGLRDRLRPTTMRCFSITTSPTDQSILQFSMRVKGKYTSAVERLKPGDKVAVRGPFGGFVFNQHLHRDVVFFAGGIGIAPFISMIRYASQLKLANKIHLVYSCRDQTDMAFAEELNLLQEQNPNLMVTYIIGSGPVDKLGAQRTMTGVLDANMLAALGLNYSKQTYFSCGPPPYMNAVTNLLREHGVLENRILTEAFSQGSHRQTGKLVSWPFNMYALSGLALVSVGFYIVASDLYATLPKLKNDSSGGLQISNIRTLSSEEVVKLEPQVDTNLEQKPKTVESSPAGSSAGSTQLTTPTVVSPTPTVTSPKTTPKTAVS
ncbi:FAD-dependent oxidoreductase [Candidatus Woesebacteria bacterium]|nr:FAD-dependent oxidoreductase [Candidatus Woesebacteria bacterium]